jgi:hypothetical protein
MLICSVFKTPEVITFAFMPCGVIPAVHESPPSSLKKMPLLVILVIPDGSVVSTVVIPFSSQVTD